MSIVFTYASVCSSVYLITELLKNYWSDHYEILCNGWTQFRDQLLKFEQPWPKVKIIRGQKVKVVFLRIDQFKIVESRHKIYICLIQFIILDMIMAVGLIISKMDGDKRSEGSGHKEIDYTC